MDLSTSGGTVISVAAEHRNGKGELIARSVSIQAPTVPKCKRWKCLWKFFWEVTYCGLLSNYHMKRVVYAEKNRHKDIPQKYRTGEDSPKNIRQAIFAIFKLSIR